MGDEGICTEASYPYKARDGSCKYSSALQSALQKQPVSIGIQADQSSFQFYSGGILTAACGTQLDHSVLAVGYDTSSSYWLVKNSWGSTWGDSGYVKLSMSGDKC